MEKINIVVRGNIIDNSHKAEKNKWAKCTFPCNATILSHIDRELVQTRI